jgi:hypothetical protein
MRIDELDPFSYSMEDSEKLVAYSLLDNLKKSNPERAREEIESIIYTDNGVFHIKSKNLAPLIDQIVDNDYGKLFQSATNGKTQFSRIVKKIQTGSKGKTIVADMSYGFLYFLRDCFTALH